VQQSSIACLNLFYMNYQKDFIEGEAFVAKGKVCECQFYFVLLQFYR